MQPSLHTLICTKEWPEKGYKKDTEYKGRQNGPQSHWWIEIPGSTIPGSDKPDSKQGGLVTTAEFDEHFKTKGTEKFSNQSPT